VPKEKLMRYRGDDHRKEGAISAEDEDSIKFEQQEVAADELPSLEMDMDLKTAELLSQAREATQAIRQSTADIQESSVPAAHIEAEITPATPAQADVLGAGAELPTSGFVGELERLANGLQDIVDARVESGSLPLEPPERTEPPGPAGDEVESLIRILWAEHARLTESVSRLHDAVAAADSSINAFKQTMSRLEEATRERMVLREPVSSPPAQDLDAARTPARAQPPTASSDPVNEADQRVALQALRSLST